MKNFSSFPGLIAALVFVVMAETVRAQDDANNPNDSSVSFQTFYDQLSSQGQWIDSKQYGYVFQPTESDPTWRPYTYGHWVNTDAGMTWASDESFGWATDHYGRWTNLDGYGWVWVPGYTWAPAWVSWREGGDDVGWAPLPPDSDVGIDYYDDDSFDFGFHIGDDCDLAYGIGPWLYNFCPILYIGDRDCWRHFRDRRDNFGFIRNTRNLTNINFRRDRGGGTTLFGRVHAFGPNVATLNAHARTPIQTARLTSVSRANEAGLRGNSLGVFAPRVERSVAGTVRPRSVSGTIANTEVNRGTDISHTLAVNSRISAPSATAAQLHAASISPSGFANARVATAGMHFSRTMAQPLTSMRTEARSATMFGSNGRTFAPTGRVSTPNLSRESQFTGEAPRVNTTRTYAPVYANATTEPARTFRPSRTTQAYPTQENTYQPSNVYRTEPTFQRSAPVYNSSSPVYHYNVPSYHPESSFHSYAPISQSHFSGSAPAARSESFGGGSHSSGGNSGSNSGGGRASGGGNFGGSHR